MSIQGELRSVSKFYASPDAVVRANDGVDLVVRPGTVHALIGENGAGKSTAMKALFGLVRPDSGDVVFGGKAVSSSWNPQAAVRRGIGMVHQHFMLAGPESVLDNLVLGREQTLLGVRRKDKERAELDALMNSTGLRVPLELAVEKLPIGLQSRCEILKVLYRKAEFLILDEPTAVLTPQEIDDFLEVLRTLRAQGKTILMVTHKLKEVLAVADEATVLRSGKTVATRKIAETNLEELSELMVGRRLQLPRVLPLANRDNLSSVLRLETDRFALELREGEITGVAGVEGNGQEALIKMLTSPFDAGKRGLALSAAGGRRSPGPWLQQLSLLGHDASFFTTAGIRKLPVAIIPADRHRDGLILDFTLTENLRLGREQAIKSDHDYFAPVSRDEKRVLLEYDVRPPDPEAKAASLSGGNQQKLVVARELSQLPPQSFVLAIHPTRGVDLGAIEFIHRRLLDVAAQGAAVLLISSELDELMALSHRIGVLYQGRFSRWFKGPPYDEAAIGLAMLGGKS